jgi:glycosyltransferase involved in cell wall biosynthesis
MNILFFCRRFYPDIGGVEKHVHEVSKRLIADGHQVTVITQSTGKHTSLNRIKIVRITKVPAKSSEKFHIWKFLWKNRNLIKEADVIHAQDVYFWYWPFRLLFLSKKSYITFHGYETYPIKKKAITSRKLSEILANGNIVVGDFIKKWYHTHPDYITYGGVEVPKTFKRPSRKDSAVFIGRLDEHTGVLEYAKAIDLIRQEYPRFKFEIIGEGKYFSKLKKYRPKGFKKNTDKYLQENNFVFASRYLSILEALANKRLVFATYDNPVKEDYLRMSPFAKFIVIEKDPEQIKKKIIHYLENTQDAKKITERGHDWAKENTWDKITTLYLNLWEI